MSLQILTQRYIDAFNDRDLGTIREMLTDDAALEDPANLFEGKEQVAEEVKNLFGATTLIFSPTDIFIDEGNQTSIIEFNITVNDDKLCGVDIISWTEGKISSLRAYVYPEKGNPGV